LTGECLQTTIVDDKMSQY